MHWDKGTLLETSGNYWQSCTLHTAVKLDIFTMLASGPQSAETIARQLKGDVRGVAALLNALAAMALLTKTQGRFANTDFAEQFLSKTSPDYTGFIVMHHHHLMASWTAMSAAVLSGKPNRTSAADTDKESERESFLMGMYNIASQTAPMYSNVIDLRDCKHLLDLGGGPGTYAIHFCRHNPGLRATVFDLPTTRAFAEKTIADFDLAERIRFKAGSYLDEKPDLGQGYDAVWLSHILHGEGPRDAEAIVAKAVAALNPGGKILIHEFILDDTMDGPLFPALFALNMLIGTDQGQAYSQGQLQEMLENNGIAHIHRLDVRSPNDAGIMMGTKS
jgi:SAM-dependent methyltransferase